MRYDDTIAYSGLELADLLAETAEHDLAGEWLVGAELEDDDHAGDATTVAFEGAIEVFVDSTVVMAGPLTSRSFVEPVPPPPPSVSVVPAAPSPPPWRWGPSLSALGILVGGMVAMLVNDAQAFGSPSEHRVPRAAIAAAEMTPLAGAVRTKVVKPPSKASGRRPSSRDAGATPEPSRDVDAIGEAQLGRPF